MYTIYNDRAIRLRVCVLSLMVGPQAFNLGGPGSNPSLGVQSDPENFSHATIIIIIIIMNA